jgi:SAM-dependent methyltransferase
MQRDRPHPLDDPRDLAYRPPLAEAARFPSAGEVDHPNLKEALYQSLGAHQVVADIGCGPGPFEYANFQAQFIAFDAFEPDSRQGMKPQDKFMLGRLDRFPLDDASCDAVVMGYILEHVPDPAAFVKEAHRVLKPGGYCYIAVPHYKSLEDRLFRLATTVAGSTRGPHIQRFTFENVQQMVSACSSLELLTWHQLDASVLWMMHPRLRGFRPMVVSGLKLLRKAGLDLVRGSNMQVIFQKPGS